MRGLKAVKDFKKSFFHARSALTLSKGSVSKRRISYSFLYLKIYIYHTHIMHAGGVLLLLQLAQIGSPQFQLNSLEQNITHLWFLKKVQFTLKTRLLSWQHVGFISPQTHRKYKELIICKYIIMYLVFFWTLCWMSFYCEYIDLVTLKKREDTQ